jgi:2-polyprenyl-3-methyl-5-hydroxy-6-metoxy-1,4-benzoquinol methylase
MVKQKSGAQVGDFYDSVAAGYYQQYQRDSLRSLEAYPANYFRLQILISRLAQSGLKRLYEIGVGEGTPLASIAGMGFDVAGCDISEAMITKARETFSKHGLSPDLIQWGDIEDPVTIAAQLRDGRFDAVIAAGVLPHVKNDERFLENLKMLVRPGGKVFIEFRNSLFSLFTFNRYTKAFVLDELLAGVSDGIKKAVAAELDKRLATDLPKPRVTGADGSSLGYDAILSRFHNPFELIEAFGRAGYSNLRLHWYHYHPAPPLLEPLLGAEFREEAMRLEGESSNWRGYFLCSAGVVEAEFSG